MRTKTLVLLLVAALLGAGLVWIGLRRSGSDPNASAASQVAERTPEPGRPSVDLATPAHSTRVEPAPTPAETAAPAPDPTPQPTEPRQAVSMRAWWEYEALSPEQLDAEADRLRSELGDLTYPLLMHRLEAGLGELLAADTSQGFSYQGRKTDNAAIMLVHCGANGGSAYRVELPREEHPDLYEVKDLQLRLRKLAAEKRSAAWQPR